MNMGDLVEMALRAALDEESMALRSIMQSGPSTIDEASKRWKRANLKTSAICKFRSELGAFHLLKLEPGTVDFELKVGRIVCGSMDSLHREVNNRVQASLADDIEAGRIDKDEATAMYKGSRLALYHIESVICDHLGPYLKDRV